ncbi:marginal zone B- and B1-cell-specific protein-like [Branchiostoma floridae]|uniref:Marginal zone B- and B1-cell-specific protein-like n=1 Tax=Branchiostoma floridae TaxID=7739 RepID=A0A9J7MDC8_BRAFL|nr:marginal zone B- and B1-cell-specific protein-like [Branchiostoma floridae]
MFLTMLCLAPGALGQTSGVISYNGPDVNSEESESMHMPDYLRCDACRVIAYKFTQKLDKMTTRPRGRGEKELLLLSEIIEGLENICDEDWKDTGVKEVEGVKRLSGPGLETKEVPGVTASGQKWPQRLHEMCHMYIGDIGEEQLYGIFKRERNLEKFMCHRKNGHCHPKNLKVKKVNDEL